VSKLRALFLHLALGLLVLQPAWGAGKPNHLLPTRRSDPISWGTFLSCLETMEHWTGPGIPDWMVHSTVYSYTARKPLYDDMAHPLLDDAGEQRTMAVHQSGRVFFPPSWRQRGKGPMPIVMYCHGTNLLKDAVASSYGGHEWMFAAAAAAYYGFAVALPDMPGMGGDSASYHPFCHARSLAFAVVDGIPAVRDLFATDPYVAGGGYAWDGRVFIMGYSEGGFASLAAAREMERHPEAYQSGKGFMLAGTAAMAGPFDISGTTRLQILRPADPFDHPFFIPYVLLGYGAVYGRVMDPLEELAPALTESREDGNILEWSNGSTDGIVVDTLIARRLGVPRDGVVLRALLRPEWVVRELEEPAYLTSPLRWILEENDVARGWAPTRPILFAQGPDDRDVPLANTLTAMGMLETAVRADGRDPQGLLSYEPLDLPGGRTNHIKGALLAIPLAFDWVYSQWRGMAEGAQAAATP